MAKVFLTIFLLSVLFIAWKFVPAEDRATMKSMIKEVWWRIALAVAVTFGLLFLALNINFNHF